MKRVTTESGSTYLYDEVNGRFKRESKEGDYGLKHADNIWHEATPINPIQEGESILWSYTAPETTGSILAAGADARIRYTTPVVSIEELPWESQ